MLFWRSSRWKLASQWRVERILVCFDDLNDTVASVVANSLLQRLPNERGCGRCMRGRMVRHGVPRTVYPPPATVEVSEAARARVTCGDGSTVGAPVAGWRTRACQLK